GPAPLIDERAEQGRLALVEEIGHAAAGPQLEIVELVLQLVGEPATRFAEIHLDPGLASMQPLEPGIAARGAPARMLAFDERDAHALAGEEVGRRGADDAAPDDEHLGGRWCHALPSNQVLRWKALRVSMHTRFQDRYSSTPAIPSSRPKPDRCRPPKEVST